MQSMHREGWDTVVIVASGDSFDQEQAALIIKARTDGRCKVIVVNDNWRRVPNADLLWACDGEWWDAHYTAVEHARFRGERWTADAPAARKYKLNFMPIDPLDVGLTKLPRIINGGGNGGYQAINLCYLFGVEYALLVGFDMQYTNGKAHWFGEHPYGLSTVHPFQSWIRRMGDLAHDLSFTPLRVTNCSKQTALHCFSRSTLAKELGYDWW